MCLSFSRTLSKYNISFIKYFGVLRTYFSVPESTTNNLTLPCPTQAGAAGAYTDYGAPINEAAEASGTVSRGSTRDSDCAIEPPERSSTEQWSAEATPVGNTRARFTAVGGDRSGADVEVGF